MLARSAPLFALALGVALAGCPDSGPPVSPDAPASVDAGLDAPVLPDAPSIDAPRDVPMRTDAPLALPDGPLGGTRYAYVMSTADIPAVTPADEAVGFDLDGILSDGTGRGCTEAVDFRSPITGSLGVDNQVAANLVPLIASMVPEGLAASIEAQIANGTSLLVLEMTGADSLIDDPLVAVHVFYGRLPAGGPPLLDVDGRIAPGQTFLVEEDLGTAPGEIVGGRLLTTIARLPLRFTFGGSPLIITIGDVRFEGTVGPTSIFSAEAGGGLTVANVVELFDAAGVTLGESAVRSLARPDLDEDASSVCNTISAGLTIEAVEAIVGP